MNNDRHLTIHFAGHWPPLTGPGSLITGHRSLVALGLLLLTLGTGCRIIRSAAELPGQAVHIVADSVAGLYQINATIPTSVSAGTAVPVVVTVGTASSPAGVTMAVVLVSLLTDTPVRPLTAMTGEITLSGNVLPVGGIKEKFLAARRAGVQTIILPAENKQDVEEDLTPDLIGDVQIHYASRIEDVLAVALPLLKARPDKLPVAVEQRVGASV